MQNKKTKIVKIVMLLIFILIMIILTIKFLPIFKNIATEEGRMNFKQEIESLGYEGIMIIVGLMVVQIFLPILPGEPVEILAGMSYGPIGGLIVIFIGAFVSSFIIFFAVRKFGRNFIYSFISKEKIEKLESSKLFSNPKKIDTILFILFLIPGTPKDLFVYIGGLLPIKPIKFLMISTFARFPSIISSTIAGSNLVTGNWTAIVVTYAITFAIAGVIIYIFNKKEKAYIKL
ncbi:MAG: TVP38/TMEM64 family protein [Clostridia bacterium]|nr:TVP38/TMEM64 family protein [Clostridia bacterium]